ncbi:MAG: amidohydrolase family protein [Acidimicrobiales bacterium]|jgi:5-methylthioadenosine/S-adenosylhomocysteine deaminase
MTAGVQRYLADVAVTCSADFEVIADAALDVLDGRIQWIGPVAEAPEVECERHALGGLVMPGLVNAHAHTPMTLVRGAGDGLPLDRWLREVMWPREGQMTPDDAWWGMTLGSAEMLRHGVTTSCEMYLFEDSVVDAVHHSGARLVMTPGVLSALHAETFGSDSSRIDNITKFRDLHHDPEGRVTVGFGPHSAYDLSIDDCRLLADAARDTDSLLHIHIAESRSEGAELEAAHAGASTVQILADAGVFGGRVLAAHSVWLDDRDLDTYAEFGVSVAHCPVSNMKLGSGTARVADMRARGITVALGTDGPASNDDLDLWQELRMAPLLARVTSLDAAALGPIDALTMATRDGARAVGLHDVGVLRPGAQADFIRLDLDDAAFVPVTSPDELIAHLGWSAAARHVTDVWVAGEQVVAGGVCTSVDEERARAEVQKRALRLAGVSTD